MAHQGVSEGAFLAFLDPYVPLLLALLVASLWLFTRWLDTGDRSAYAVGAAAAVLAPVWVLGALFLRFVEGGRGVFPVGLEQEPLFAWSIGWVFWVIGLVLVLALLWFLVWPLTLTGAFLFAPQGQVRRRFKTLETSWQFGIAALLAVKAAVLLFDLLDPYI